MKGYINFLLIAVILSIVLVSGGCDNLGKVLEKAEETQGGGKELTTDLAAARDLTGRWEGSLKFNDVANSPICEYKGSIALDLLQANNGLTGTWQIVITEETPLVELKSADPCVKELGPGPLNSLEGSVSSSQFDFITVGFPDFRIYGSATEDQLKGNIDFCIPYGECLAVVGSEGTFTALRSELLS